MSQLIRVGTRKSKLALSQTKQLISKINSLNPELTFEIIGISTNGNRQQASNLLDSSVVGWFTKELENALLNKHIDIAIHSLKDVPTNQPPELCLIAFPLRVTAEDILLFKDCESQERWQNFSSFIEQQIQFKVEKKEGNIIQKTPQKLSINSEKVFKNFTIGTASPRREMFLAQYRSLGVQSKLIRGNIDTRISKLQQFTNSYDAIILAKAGLSRLGMDYPFVSVLSKELLIPAPGQGALVIQCRREDHKVKEKLKSINDQETYYAISSERYFMKLLEAGCKTPLGAYAELKGEKIILKTQMKRQKRQEEGTTEQIVFYELLTTIATYKKDVENLINMIKDN